MKTIIFLLVFSFCSIANAKQPIDVLLADLKVSLEKDHKQMRKIVQNNKESRCLNLRDCNIDIQENNNIDTYFKDDIDMALEDLSL